jgi:hypothetical protein
MSGTLDRLAAGRLRRLPLRRPVPPLVVKLGDLVGVIYRSDRDRPGRPRTYIHVMRYPPLLVCDLGGRQLYIVGGRYHVTGRGIEDGPAVGGGMSNGPAPSRPR